MNYSNLNNYLNNNRNHFAHTNRTSLDNFTGFETVKIGFSGHYAIFIERDNKIFEILFGNRSSKNELTETDKNILSSFEFIE